jgi:FlaA1/EpsC-like NDP-sugar epimerase
MGEQEFVTKVANDLYPGYPQKIIGIKEGEKFEEELMTAEEQKRAIKKDKFYLL